MADNNKAFVVFDGVDSDSVTSSVKAHYTLLAPNGDVVIAVGAPTVTLDYSDDAKDIEDKVKQYIWDQADDPDIDVVFVERD